MTLVALASAACARHPCFSPHASRGHGRIHLAVAPDCNIQCRYCDRRLDCPNESRPGVASRVLTPMQALEHLSLARQARPWLSVAGIAGPGDPFCEPESTLRTLELVRASHPDLLLCLSSNGLGLLEHIPRLLDLGVGFMTLTINAIDAKVGKEIYAWISHQGLRLTGGAAFELLRERQLAALVALKAGGVTVKINTVVAPGVNDRHVPELARQMAALGADLMNLIPLIPLPGTALARVRPPSRELMEDLRRSAARFLPQMRHCRRCRADAVGLLDETSADGYPPRIAPPSSRRGPSRRGKPEEEPLNNVAADPIHPPPGDGLGQGRPGPGECGR
ncbi:MAG: radical SAM protein [Desulfarculus sp.]|nr:radical SAM protein [Desulfarculus sp.]